jgi:hypothetical protein
MFVDTSELFTQICSKKPVRFEIKICEKRRKFGNFLKNLSGISAPISLKKPDRFSKNDQKQEFFELKIRFKTDKTGEIIRRGTCQVFSPQKA